MPVIVSHCSALELLRAVPPQARLYPRVGEPLELKSISTSPRELAALDLGGFGIRREPVHVLVAGESREIKASGVRTHWFGLPTMPGGLLLELAPGIYVAGPELCFVQMARSASTVGAVVLGYELCGWYSHFAEMVSGYYERPPLTSVEMMGAAISELSGLYGLGRAQEALEHMGWTINTIKLDQMVDHRELMKAVALFEDAIPRQKGGPAPAEEVAELHERLLRATRCGMGMERAVFGVPVPRGLVKMHIGG